MTNQDIAILARIAQGVTAEQIGKCTKVYDFQLKQNVYLVENSKGETDNDGNIIEYKVQYSKEHGFTCNCEAGKRPFAHCKNYCWHVRASVAAVVEEATALAEIARKVEEERREALQREFEERRAQLQREHDEKHAAMPIEVKMKVSKWMLERPVARHMRKSPKELN